MAKYDKDTNVDANLLTARLIRLSPLHRSPREPSPLTPAEGGDSTRLFRLVSDSQLPSVQCTPLASVTVEIGPSARAPNDRPRLAGTIAAGHSRGS